jgi:WXXGXW repeat (2 copies)
MVPIASNAQVICISNASPPPELPVYEQPAMPEPGHIWTPGYWGGGPYGYFWVPGTWVQPPTVGLLWTPGYWGWRDGIYVWSAGYWGPHVGFYGGINYGFGYAGVGYEGGHWENGAFAYNRTVNNFGGVSITNVYEKTVIVDPGATRVSFNGGGGGTAVLPTPEQETAAHEQHVAAIPAQLQHERTASANKALLASENHGQPSIAATAKPNELTGKGVVAAQQVEPSVTPTATKPTNATAVGPNPTESKAVEKKEQANKNQTMPNGATPPVQPKAETKSSNATQQPHPSQPEQEAVIKRASPPPGAHTDPEQAAVKPAPHPPAAHSEEPEQAAVKPAPHPPAAHTEEPEQAAVKPAPHPPAAHTEEPERAAIKPAAPPQPPPHAERPAPAGIKPAPSIQPPSAAPAAAKPSPPPNKPGCPPGKTLAEVNGHPVCK